MSDGLKIQNTISDYNYFRNMSYSDRCKIRNILYKFWVKSLISISYSVFGIIDSVLIWHTTLTNERQNNRYWLYIGFHICPFRWIKQWRSRYSDFARLQYTTILFGKIYLINNDLICIILTLNKVRLMNLYYSPFKSYLFLFE